jgi:hypothetical protein
MLVLRCTRKLLARLKQSEPFPAVESTTRLGDWYGNTLQLGRRQYLLFISEHSRLPVILPVSEAKHLATVLPDAICLALAAVGVAEADIAAERACMSDVAFGRTRSRSLLGTMADYAFMSQHVRDVGRQATPAADDLMHFLAQTPILPLKGARPVDLTRARFRYPLGQA